IDRPSRRAKMPRRSESFHSVFRSNGPHLGEGIKLNTALHSAKFLIVRTPTSAIANLTLEISRENPKYDEFTNRSTWLVSPGSASMGRAYSGGPLSGS